MCKVKSYNLKICIIILAFSLIITIAFVGMLVAFSSDFNNENSLNTMITPQTYGSNTYVLTLSAKETEQFVNGTFQLTQGNISSISIYNKNYLNYLMNQILPYAVCFCILLFALSVVLWRILRRIQANNNMLIINQLNSIQDIDAFSADNPALIQAYENLKQKFDDNLRDYKRLNSYISHEQKNAVAILRTRLELSDHQEYLPELDSISESIDDVLTLSETKDTVIKTTVDMALICAAVCDSYQHMQKNITFTFDENDDTEILAKERWIYCAVSNLVSNAIKYGNGKPIEVGVRGVNHSVIVTVKDHGIGIDKENQKKIFNHRYRINELNKDGYGIGLSLVAHVCDLCGGFAIVESKPLEGSTFYLSFPGKKSW